MKKLGGKMKKTLTILFLLILMASALFADLNDGLIAYYPFNGNANDESGNGNDGVPYNVTLTNNRFNQPENAYYFNGSNSEPPYIEIANLNSYNVMSISVWFKCDDDIPYGAIISGDHSGWDRGLHIYNNNQLTVQYGSGYVNTGFEVNYNEWIHAILMFTDDDIILNINNGEFIWNYGSPASGWNEDQGWNIGNAPESNHAYPFKGAIDDVRIYDRTLSNLEITMLYGLVAYYPFNGNANDESGNGSNGTVNSATLTTDRFGNENSAFDFNGSDNRIEVPDCELLDLTQNYSVSVWFALNSSRNNYRIINKDGGNDYNNGWSLFYNSESNNLQWSHYPENGINSDHISIPSNIQIDSWQNITITFDGITFSSYFNGEFVNSAIPSGLIGGNELPVEIGGSVEYNQFFNGKIDDIRIYNRALSETEITELYTEGLELTSQFTVDDTTAFVGYPIQFTDLSTAGEYPISTWEWDFDNDGNIDSNDGNPQWTYNAEGTYTVSLTVTDTEGRATSTETKTDYITVTTMDLNEGLVAYYPFNGNANDESGNGNNGTNYGAATIADRFGNENSAYEFDGSNDYVKSVIDHSSYTEFTQSFWIKINDSSHINSFGGWQAENNDQETFITSEQIFFDLKTNGEIMHTTSSFSEFYTWVHITVTFMDSEYMRIYKNGILLDTNENVANWNHPETNNFIIGTKPRTLNHNFFEGGIDDIRIYNRALSETEIQALYHENLGKPIISSPDTLGIDFGSVYLGDTSPDSLIVIENIGADTLYITSLSFEEGTNAFGFNYPNLNNPILPSETDTVFVNFSPTSALTYIDSLVITNNSDNKPIMKIELQGCGIEIPPAVPENVNIVINGLNAEINWDPVTTNIYGTPMTIDYYLIYRSTSSPFESFQVVGYVASGTTNYTDSGVGLFNQKAFYKVTAYKNLSRETLKYLDEIILFNKDISKKEIEQTIEMKSKKAHLKTKR